MKPKLCISIIVLSTFFSIYENANAQSPNWLWGKAIGGATNDIGHSIAIDASGNVYTTGSFEGIVDFDPGAGTFNLTASGSSDIFISKLDASGNFVWAKAFGGPYWDIGYSIAIDVSGNVYTTGTFEGTTDFDPGVGVVNLTSFGTYDIFISKLDGSGNFVWAKAEGGIDSDYGMSITLDSSGNVYTTGYFNGAADFDPGSSGTFNLTSAGTDDIFISKLDNSGNFIWAKAIGGISYDWGSSIAVDVSGNVYTTGAFRDSVDFDPGVGTFYLTSGGFSDAFILKLDSSGDFDWAKAIRGPYDDGASSIVIDPSVSGDVYTTGAFSGTTDFDPDSSGIFNLTSVGLSNDIFILKLDSSGNFIWAKAMGGTNDDRCYAIALDASGNIYNTGYFNGTADFDPGTGVFNLISTGYEDVFISKLDGSGNFLWAKAMDGTTNDEGNSIALDASGNALVAGYFSSPSISFGSITLTNSNASGFNPDIFVAKLDHTITGMENLENSNNAISVFPNPSDGKFTILFNKEINNTSVKIFNTLGEAIYLSEINTNESGKSEIILNQAKAGIYLLQVNTGEKHYSKKIIIQ